MLYGDPLRLSSWMLARRTFVIIAHRASLIRAADKLLVLREGRAEAFGPAAEVVPQASRPQPVVSTQPAASGSMAVG